MTLSEVDALTEDNVAWFELAADIPDEAFAAMPEYLERAIKGMIEDANSYVHGKYRQQQRRIAELERMLEEQR